MKNTLLKSGLLLLLINFSLSIANAQESEWSLLSESADVKIYYQLFDCVNASQDPLALEPGMPNQYIRLKIQNTSTSIVTVSWNSETTSTGGSNPQSQDFGIGETLFEDCDRSPIVKLGAEGYPISMSEFLEYFQLQIN